MNNQVKTVQESSVEISHIVRPTHLNATGRLFGGILLQWIDETAGIIAKRHCNHDIITAAIDNLQFLSGAYQHEVIVLIGRLTFVGNTSMEIRIDTYAEDITGERKLINTAYLVMVALDQQGNSCSVPRLRIETEEEKYEWELAKKRQIIRKHRMEEGY